MYAKLTPLPKQPNHSCVFGTCIFYPFSPFLPPPIEDGEVEVKVESVKLPILTKVVEYLNYHVDKKAVDIEKPLKSANLSELTPALDPWDVNFVSCEQDVLFEIILAANFMDIRPLLDLACAKVASMIKGKTPEEIRKTFNIKNDFTPEEEAAIREENKWCVTRETRKTPNFPLSSHPPPTYHTSLLPHT